MKVTPRQLSLFVTLLLGLVLLGLPTRALVENPPAKPDGPLDASFVRTELPVKRSFSETIPWLGRVKSKAAVTLVAQTPGRITAIEVADQSPVAAGQAIARLGGPQLETTRARLQDQISTLTSLGELNRQSLARLQKALLDQLATKDQLATAQEKQVKLESELRQARLELKNLQTRSRIRAPMAGIFTQRTVAIGQEVQAGAVIGSVIDPAHLQIVASLFPPATVKLKDRAVVVQLDETRTFAGRVSAVLPEATATGATQVWLEGQELDQALRPGQTVRGKLVLADSKTVLAVPEAAIVYDDKERPCLFIADSDSYELRRVKLGLSQDGWIAVRSGLTPEQRVVTRGAYELFYRQFNQQFKVPD